jgi:hypothetical protein
MRLGDRRVERGKNGIGKGETDEEREGGAAVQTVRAA